MELNTGGNKLMTCVVQVREKFLSLKKDAKVEVVSEAEEVWLISFHLSDVY
jgi:hypothetical protein